VVCATRWGCGSLRVQVPILDNTTRASPGPSIGDGTTKCGGRNQADWPPDGQPVGWPPKVRRLGVVRERMHPAPRSPLHGSAGVGAANRSTPTGASANGMP
jgi:hypothetical protein